MSRDSVKVLTEADSQDLAKRDVSTFVISPQMRRMLTEQLFPHLRLDGTADTKGVFVVANYGTGKTHLMSSSPPYSSTPTCCRTCATR